MPGEFLAADRFEIPVRYVNGIKRVDRKAAKAALIEAGLGSDIGVYVFAMQAGKGIRPWYVGKTTKSFASECFTDNKLLKYNDVVPGKGRPFLYLLTLSSKVNKRAIEELESLMIGVALQKNPALLNLAKTKQYEVIVHGVVNSSAGAPTKEARAFRRMIGLQKKAGLR
jgi:hypothetical protein